MNDPIYQFVKGKGWILTRPSHVLTKEDCQGDWIHKLIDGEYFHYPKICETWTFIPRVTELKVGDIIPYVDMVDIVFEIDGEYARCHRGYKAGGTFATNYCNHGTFEPWYGVARRV